MLAEEGDIQSLQYTLPPEGLTLVINVPEGEANIYGSYTIRNPTYFTADFMTGGSGVLTYYIPSPQSSKKRQADGGEVGNAFISVIAKKPNTTFTLNATDGDVLTMRGRMKLLLSYSCRMHFFCFNLKFSTRRTQCTTIFQHRRQLFTGNKLYMESASLHKRRSS